MNTLATQCLKYFSVENTSVGCKVSSLAKYSAVCFIRVFQYNSVIVLIWAVILTTVCTCAQGNQAKAKNDRVNWPSAFSCQHCVLLMMHLTTYQ